MKIAFRGYGNHAKKVENIIKRSHPNLEAYTISRDFLPSEIKPETKGIFICSVNSSHISYIEKAMQFIPKIPIYCEKPILNSSKNYNQINRIINSSRIFPGFNLRRSLIPSLIGSGEHQKKLGKVKSFHVNHSYPFALKPSYLNSWKADRELSPLGIFENLSIHYIDLAIYLFGRPVRSYFEFAESLNSVPRSSHSLMRHESGVISTIHNSYTSPLSSYMSICFENGKLEINNSSTSIYSPNLLIDPKTNLCLKSPRIYKKKITFDQIFEKSLSKSIALYLSKCIEQTSLKIDDCPKTTSLTMEMLYQASQQIENEENHRQRIN